MTTLIHTVFVILCVGLYVHAEIKIYDTISQDLIPPALFTNQTRKGRIVNGQDAALNQFPHQALLIITFAQGRALCGGSLIAPSWILSAAHCIINARAVEVQLGSINPTSMPVKKNGVKIYRPSTYNPRTLRDDLSLIKLESPVTLSDNVKTIGLESASSVTDLSGKILRVSGFGLTTSNQLASTLQFTDVIGITTAACRSTYGSMITTKILCTLGNPSVNSGTCSGDSGGPLISKDAIPVQVGIVSFGSAQGCDLGAPQGFTRVKSHVAWIKSITGIK